MECIEFKINNFYIKCIKWWSVSILFEFCFCCENLIEYDMIRKYLCEEREKESERERESVGERKVFLKIVIILFLFNLILCM